MLAFDSFSAELWPGRRWVNQEGTGVGLNGLLRPFQHRGLLENAAVLILLSLMELPSASTVRSKLPAVPGEGEVMSEYKSTLLSILYIQVLREGPANLLDCLETAEAVNLKCKPAF